MRKLGFIVGCLLAFAGIATAQTVPTLSDVTPIAPADIPAAAAPLSETCPVQVESALTATELICTNVGDNTACIGNGIIEATPHSNVANFQFSQPSDRANLTTIAELRLRTLDTENAIWAVVRARPEYRTVGSKRVTATLLAFGDVTLVDDGERPQELQTGNQRTGRIIAERGLVVRRAPDTTGVVVWQLGAGEEITVTGITADRAWLRIEIPSYFSGAGWVYAYYVDVTGGAETLPVVDVNTPRPTAVPPPQVDFGAMQAFKLISAPTNPACANTPDSGVLIQSPDAEIEETRFKINGVTFIVNGTLFVQAQASARMTVRVLEGYATLQTPNGDLNIAVNESGIVQMSDNLTPVDVPIADFSTSPLLSFLPVSALPRLVLLPRPAPATEAVATTEETVTTAEVVATEAPVEVVAQPTTAPAVSGSMVSSVYGEICTEEGLSVSESAAPVGISTDLGSLWTATAGTRVTITVLGGTFQPTIGNFIKLNSVAGVLAESGDNATLTHTFAQDGRFSVTFSSRAGDTLIVSMRCGG